MTKNTHKQLHTTRAPETPHGKTPACECGCEGKCSCGCCGSLGKILVLGTSILAFALSAAALTKGPDTKAIEKWVNENPQVIDKVMVDYYRKLDAERRSAEAEKPKEAPADLVNKIIDDPTNYSLGNPKGKFDIIEFFDYNCGWCKRTNAAMKEALAKPEAKNIRWIPIDTPLFGPDSEQIARYVLAAGKQGKYAAMHDAVGDHKGKVDEAALVQMATTLGLNVEQLKKDANSKELKDKIEANKEYTRALNLSGVPMLIVDGKVHPGALFGEELDNTVAQSAK